MKKCPNCQKTYDDNLKFCQADGTPLVAVAEDTPEENPYKTVVGDASSLPIPPEEKKPEAKPEPEPEPEPEQEMDPFKTMVAGSKVPPPKEEDVLEVPESPVDPMKTMVVSGQTSGNIDLDIPEEEEKEESAAAESAPAPEASTSEPAPSAPQDEPEPASVAEPPAADAPAPETPSSAAPPAADKPSEPERPSVPIPSPFEESMPPGFAPPTTPPFEEKVTPIEPKAQAPVPEPEPEPEKVQEPVAEPLPTDFSDVSAGGDDIGEVEPAVPAATSGEEIEASGAQPPAEGQAPNQTLSWVSLALGVLSLPCCMSYIFGIAAIIVGFMARSKASAEPQNYGGGTYAMIGIVLGLVSVLLGTILWVVQILLGGLADFLR